MDKGKKMRVAATIAALAMATGTGLPAFAQQSNPAPQQKQQQNPQPVNLDRNQIEQVQRALDQKGFHSGRADGIVGNKTEDALRSFQSKQGLHASGQIDQETLATLGLDNMTHSSTVGQGGGNRQQPQGSSQNSNSK